MTAPRRRSAPAKQTEVCAWKFLIKGCLSSVRSSLWSTREQTCGELLHVSNPLPWGRPIILLRIAVSFNADGQTCIPIGRSRCVQYKASCKKEALFITQNFLLCCYTCIYRFKNPVRLIPRYLFPQIRAQTVYYNQEERRTFFFYLLVLTTINFFF